MGRQVKVSPSSCGVCSFCGKRSYLSRKKAKAASRHHDPGTVRNAYECEGNPGYYHYGRLPKKIKDGRMPRALLKTDVVVSR